MTDGNQRRLAAIVAVDVVGYSRMMEGDETGTLSILRGHRAGMIDPLIGRHDGRIVKTLGDGLLLEFSSVVTAVEFALAMQRGMIERNAEFSDTTAMRFRVGVHVGDVIIEGDDIFGDGVNVASRIEGQAETGGVCLSDDAYRQVRDRLDASWRDGGEQQVKNISRPVHVWHWQPDDAVAAATSGTEGPALPDKPSVAVLPFDNMSNDPEQEFFADGMTEDLITDLSKVSGLFVVARNSSFVFKGKAVDIREAAKQLGVRFVVEGSVRKAGTRVRINVQLIDAASGGHVWAERYDGSIDNVFELQDEVGAKIVSALSVQLRGDESNRLRQVHTHNLDAYELFARARTTPYPPVPDRIAAATEMFEKVIETAPDFAGGYAGKSWMIGVKALFGNADLADSAELAIDLAHKAIEVDDRFGWSHASLGMGLFIGRRPGEALEAIDRAIGLQPNDSDVHAYQALFLALSGRPADAVGPIEQAIRLNPQFIHGPYLNLKTVIHILCQDYDQAVAASEKNVARQGPVGPPAIAWTAGAYHELGRSEDAARLVGQLRSRFPAFRLSGWNFLELVQPVEARSRFEQSMLSAGVPG